MLLIGNLDPGANLLGDLRGILDHRLEIHRDGPLALPSPERVT